MPPRETKAGNDHNGTGQYFPAALDLPNIISVAASTADDQLAFFSNYGLTSVDLAAPGQDVGSTVPRFVAPFPYSGGGAGTSFAAPHVSGAAALMLARNPSLSYAELKDRILTNVDILPAFEGKTVTGGRLNVYRALAAVPAPAGPPPDTSTSAVFSKTIATLGPRELLATVDDVLA